MNFAGTSLLQQQELMPGVQERCRGYLLADVFPSQDLPTGLALKAPQVPLLIES